MNLYTNIKDTVSKQGMSNSGKTLQGRKELKVS